MDWVETMVSQSPILETIRDIPMPNKIPMPPPRKLIKTDSIRNCCRISLFLAPIALRIFFQCLPKFDKDFSRLSWFPCRDHHNGKLFPLSLGKE